MKIGLSSTRPWSIVEFRRPVWLLKCNLQAFRKIQQCQGLMVFVLCNSSGQIQAIVACNMSEWWCDAYVTLWCGWLQILMMWGGFFSFISWGLSLSPNGRLVRVLQPQALKYCQTSVRRSSIKSFVRQLSIFGDLIQFNSAEIGPSCVTTFWMVKWGLNCPIVFLASSWAAR